MRKITIDPVTRIEGHGKIEILLDKEGEVERAYFQTPGLRGFEKFCEGRPAEEMPRITQRICGGSSTAHHMASTKALDDLFKVEPTPVAKNIRELMYNAFIAEHHILHFFCFVFKIIICSPVLYYFIQQHTNKPFLVSCNFVYFFCKKQNWCRVHTQTPKLTKAKIFAGLKYLQKFLD